MFKNRSVLNYKFIYIPIVYKFLVQKNSDVIHPQLHFFYNEIPDFCME